MDLDKRHRVGQSMARFGAFIKLPKRHGMGIHVLELGTNPSWYIQDLESPLNLNQNDQAWHIDCLFCP